MLDSGRKSAVLMAGFVLLMHCSQGLYMHSVLQELGYMARRGHKTGIICTDEHTWLLKAEEGGVYRYSLFKPRGWKSCVSYRDRQACNQCPNGGRPPVNDHAACMFTKHASLASAILACMPLRLAVDSNVVATLHITMVYRVVLLHAGPQSLLSRTSLVGFASEVLQAFWQVLLYSVLRNLEHNSNPYPTAPHARRTANQ